MIKEKNANIRMAKVAVQYSANTFLINRSRTPYKQIVTFAKPENVRRETI